MAGRTRSRPLFLGLFAGSLAVVSGCATPAPKALSQPLAPRAQDVKPRVRYVGPVMRVGQSSAGRAEILSPAGWTLNQQAPTTVWVYSSDRLGNAPQRLDTPKSCPMLEGCLQVPVEVVPLLGGPAILYLRVRGALCRQSQCVPIDQELGLTVAVSEDE